MGISNKNSCEAEWGIKLGASVLSHSWKDSCPITMLKKWISKFKKIIKTYFNDEKDCHILLQAWLFLSRNRPVSDHPLKDWDIAKHPANTYINIRTNCKLLSSEIKNGCCCGCHTNKRHVILEWVQSGQFRRNHLRLFRKGRGKWSFEDSDQEGAGFGFKAPFVFVSLFCIIPCLTISLWCPLTNPGLNDL